ncbi:MAG: T9SS type A sorting domain-containing protein, partial [Ignavibacteria bacterium]
FNRDWDSPSYWNAVRDVKTKIIQTSAQNRIKIFIDSHDPFPSAADTASRLFMYSFTDTGRKSANLNIFRNKLFTNGGYWFGRQTIYPTSGQTSSRWVDSMFASIDFSTSIETGWVSRTDGNTWTIYFYTKHGEVIGKGISDYIGQSTPVIENNEVVNNYSTAYPNPFNAAVNIKFSISQRNKLNLLVYDINGREVSRVYFGTLNTGNYTYNFNALNLSSGVYFYTINGEDGNSIFKGKMLLLK